jgi:hypothetical protein
MIEIIGPLYIWLQQFTNQYLTHCHLLEWTISTSDHTSQLNYSIAFGCTPSILTVASYNSSARIVRKTPSSFVKNACLLVHQLAIEILLVLSAYASGMCLPSLCLATDIYVTIRTVEQCFSSMGVFQIGCDIFQMGKICIRWPCFPVYPVKSRF